MNIHNNEQSSKRNGERAQLLLDMLVPCLVVSLCVAALLQTTGLLYRSELQNINRLFEARQWLSWSEESLSRLNPRLLWQYHQTHEIPRNIFAWDYTLSWLLEKNQAPAKHKFVIFNHSLEDEPPKEGVQLHPWMQPLLSYPTPRSTIAEAVDFLAGGGARLIILDNDFPQYSKDDAMLALAIHRAEQGLTSGHPVPVLMASTVNRNGFSNGIQLDATTLPVGILTELAKLEPGIDVADKYTGISSVALDEDQVLRRLVTRVTDESDQTRLSVVLKAIDRLHEPIPADLPELMDINFIGPPNSDQFPVRPFWYLLDPDRRKLMLQSQSKDVTINGAIVIIGDGVTDVHPTPGTSLGVSLMSGSEVLAQSIDSVSRHNWPRRLSGLGQWLYLAICCVIGSAGTACARRFRPKTTAFKLGAIAELLFYIGINILIILSGLVAFAYAGLIVPVVVPCIALTAGVTVALIAEREQTRVKAIRSRLAAADANLRAEKQRHEAQLKTKEAEARVQQSVADHRRREEFVRRINHDLKAPVTVLNWTLAKLRKEGLTSARAGERLEHLEQTSDRLVALIAQIGHIYTSLRFDPHDRPNPVCDLRGIILRCTQMEDTLAEVRRSQIRLHLPDYALPVAAAPLDMERILDNLLRNALLHNPQATWVDVSARVCAHCVEIIVADDGQGISANDLPRIFDEGFSTVKDAGEREGLGLAIVKAMVEKHGGTVTVESIEDVGTSVTLKLPRAADTVYGARPVDQIYKSTENKGETICRELP
ncbi:MAG TPA: ATP-binding protein [Candidatus Obscuribacterales bacterium]